MKKRIIAVLLSAVMMVPSVSVGAADFAEGNGEQIFSEGEETRELIFTEGEDTVDFSSEENTQEVFSAESSADGIILNEKTFIKGKTYLIPVSLKNAANHEKDSAAVSCPGKFATLYIGEDGIPKLTVNLRSVTVGTMTDYAYDFKIYQSAGTDGEKQGAFV